MKYLKLSLYFNHDTAWKLWYIDHTRMHRPINDYTTHKQHIYIKHQNTHIYTITQQIHNTNHMSIYIFFYLLAVIAVINFIKKKKN